MNEHDTTVQALVLVDLQRDYFQDPRLCDLEDELVEAATRLAARAREVGALVVEVRTVHDPHGSTWALNMRDDGQGSPSPVPREPSRSRVSTWTRPSW